MTQKCAFFAMAAWLLLSAPLVAGGPPWLTLPIDGVTPENETACIDLLTAKLKGTFFTNPGQFSGIHIRRDGDQAYAALFLADDVSLRDIETALKGSQFSVPRDRLHLFGHLTLSIEPRSASPQALLADLNALDHVSVDKSDSKDDLLIATVDMPYPVEDGRPYREAVGWDTFQRNDLASDPSTRSEPAARPAELPSYNTFHDLASTHGAELKDIRWTTEYACRPVGGTAAPSLDASVTATQSAATSAN